MLEPGRGEAAAIVGLPRWCATVGACDGSDPADNVTVSSVATAPSAVFAGFGRPPLHRGGDGPAMNVAEVQSVSSSARSSVPLMSRISARVALVQYDGYRLPNLKHDMADAAGFFDIVVAGWIASVV
ncbi:hypothetical protein [Kaistia algarum]|uniref:hypothetical protein n=1 Tax=Kaistia algarum TaxID=2083279 RepID=UPI001A9C4C78|nr:hypothetical protein [Kaistia algarum]MCX5512545.1 hypothetical protein [Kaistia algarum]